MEEALDLSFDRLLMMMNIIQVCSVSYKEPSNSHHLQFSDNDPNIFNVSYFQFDCWLEDREIVLWVLVYRPGYETVQMGNKHRSFGQAVYSQKLRCAPTGLAADRNMKIMESTNRRQLSTK